jgi:ABC-type multidrug transport system permease subunit
MIREIWPVLWDEWIVFKRSWFQITTSAIIGPILYIVAFGLGLGGGYSLQGVTYVKFLIPGIVALTTMNASYKAISTPLATGRIYNKTFEQFLIAPISMVSYCMGKAIAGSLRGFYAGLMVMGVAILFGVRLHVTPDFFFIMLLSGLTFACLGMFGAMVVKSHADMNRFGTFVMLPMTFLCGTFFSLDQLPVVMKEIIYIFPLTHISTMLRAIATYEAYTVGNLLTVGAYFIVFFLLALYRCYKVAA